MLRKRILPLICSGLVCLTFTSCMEDEGFLLKDNISNVSVSWWGSNKRNDYMIKTMEDFCADNKDITINTNYSEYKGYQNKISANLDCNSEADVMMLEYGTMYEYSKKSNAFLNLYSLKGIKLDNFSNDDLMFCQIGGSLKGIPVSISQLNFFYNKNILNRYQLEIPKTWEDIFKAAEIMKDDNIYPLSFNEDGFFLACNAYNEQVSGRTLFNSAEEFIGSKEDIARMLEFYVKLVKGKVAKRAENFQNSDLENYRTAGVVTWADNIDLYLTSAIKAGSNIDIGKCPTTKEYKRYGWYTKPTMVYSIKRDSANPEAAAKTLNYILNNEQASAHKGVEQGIPTSRSAIETLEAKSLQNGLALRVHAKMESNKEISPVSGCLVNPKLITLFSAACNKVYFGRRTAEDAADEFMQEINKTIPESYKNNVVKK